MTMEINLFIRLSDFWGQSIKLLLLYYIPFSTLYGKIWMFMYTFCVGSNICMDDINVDTDTFTLRCF